MQQLRRGLPDHVDGVVRLLRGEPSEPPCKCCNGGPHVFGERIEIEPMPSIFAGLQIKSVADWLGDYLSRYRFALEGQRVRVKIEVVDEERDARIARALERLDLDERAAAHYPPAVDDGVHTLPAVGMSTVDCRVCEKPLPLGVGRYNLPGAASVPDLLSQRRMARADSARG
jgi:hypothetical protein